MLETKYFVRNYDITSLSFRYGRLGGPSGEPVQPKHGGYGGYGVQTVGSSTTVTAVAGTPFDPVVVGDLIVFQKLEQVLIRTVTAKASGASITVDTAVDLSGGFAGWYFYPFREGTAVTDGWHKVDRYVDQKTVLIDIATFGGSTNLIAQIEGKGAGLDETPHVLTTVQYTTVGTDAIQIPENVSALRVGLRYDVGFAGTDSVTVSVCGIPSAY